MRDLTKAIVLCALVLGTTKAVMTGYQHALDATDQLVGHTYGSPQLQAINPDLKDINAQYEASRR